MGAYWESQPWSLMILIAASTFTSELAQADSMPMPELGTFVVANNLEPTPEGCEGDIEIAIAPRPIDATGRVLVDVLPDCAVEVSWESVVPTALFGSPSDVRIYANAASADATYVVASTTILPDCARSSVGLSRPWANKLPQT